MFWWVFPFFFFFFFQIQKSKSQSVFSRLCIVTQLVFHVIIAPPSLHICCLPFSLLISSRWMAQTKDLTSPQWSCCPEISLPYTMLFPSLCLKQKGVFSDNWLDCWIILSSHRKFCKWLLSRMKWVLLKYFHGISSNL